MMEIFKSFTFDAAHHLSANVPAGHPYARLHGHSFEVTVHVRGTPDPATGWIRDFAELAAALGELRGRLDHRLLNEIAGLETPTLEALTCWIWRELAPRLPGLCRVVVQRGRNGEGCMYEGEGA